MHQSDQWTLFLKLSVQRTVPEIQKVVPVPHIAVLLRRS